LPGCKNDRGTQHGDNRSNPPPASSAASNGFFTLLEMVYNCLTDVVGIFSPFAIAVDCFQMGTRSTVR
jgi:hypothetical protein